MRDQAFVTDCVTPHPLHRWHLRLGHLGVQQVAKLKNSGAVTGVNISNYSLRDLPLCDGCVLGIVSLFSSAMLRVEIGCTF